MSAPARSFVAVLILWLAASTAALAVVGQPAPARNYQEGEVLVKFVPGLSHEARERSLRAAGCREASAIKLVPGLSRAQIVSGLPVTETIRRLQTDPNVVYAEPNFIVSAALTPNDPRYPELYGLNNTGQTGGTADADIDAPEAWDLQTGTDIVVAVIDTGLDYNHEDIAGNVWSNPGEIAGNGIDDDNNGYIDDTRGWDFVNNDNDPFDDNDHGTHVSGTIAAVGNNAVGVVGVNWRARIMPLKFLSATGSGTTADAIEAVDYSVLMGARVSSNSWGGGAFSQALSDAIAAAGAAGQVFAAAAGNASANNDTTPSYPCSYTLANIICVAATDDDDLLATFSNYGAASVDLGAPGVSILSTTPANTYASFSGTSMATPHVAGVAALALASDASLTVADLKALVLDNADAITALAGITVTSGRLNAYNTLQALNRVVVSPATATVAVGATQQFTATGGTAPYTWSVADPTVGSIDATGLFTALAAGATTVSATDAAGLTGSSGTITVTTVVVSPDTANLGVGQTLQFSASGGTPPYAWTSADPAVASIDAATGLLTALAPGTTTVTATDANGFADTSGAITVSQISVSPQTALLAVGHTLQFSASGGTPPYTFSSSNLAVATIDASTGLLTAVGAGTATVTATDANGVAGSSGTIEVREIVVTPQTASLIVGDTLQFTASGGRAPYAWSVSDPAVASIDAATGLLTALAPGSVIVTATDADGIAGRSGAITVTDNHVIAITPSTARVRIFGTVQFTAAGGTAPYTWSLSNPAVGTISSTGLFRARRTGTTTVIATDADGHVGRTGTVTVVRH